MCDCKVGPGKFEGEPAVTFMAWEQVMLGNSDATTFDVEDRPTDWLRSPLNLDADASVVKSALAYGYCAECVAEAGTDIGGGIAVWEDGQGFVGSTIFETRADFDAALLAEETATESEDDAQEQE